MKKTLLTLFFTIHSQAFCHLNLPLEQLSDFYDSMFYLESCVVKLDDVVKKAKENPDKFEYYLIEIEQEVRNCKNALGINHDNIEKNI